MQVKRLQLSDAPLELFDKLAGNYFFSSSSFAKIWKTIGGTPVYWVAEEDAGDLVAVMSGVEFGKGLFRRFQSMPDGCYMSLLFNESVVSDKAKISSFMAAKILNEGYVKIFINDYYKSCTNFEKYNTENCLTFLVNISVREWEPLDSKLRQQIHKAERAGLKLEKFDSSKHLDDFMQLVRLHEKRRNVKVRYNREFFNALAEISQNDKRIKWIWCQQENKPVSSHIFILEGESILHWQMYYDESYSDLQATKYIPYKVAKEAAEQGVRTLNLGSSPPEAEGADFYKSKWGGEEYNYNCFVYKSILGRIL